MGMGGMGIDMFPKYVQSIVTLYVGTVVKLGNCTCIVVCGDFNSAKNLKSIFMSVNAFLDFSKAKMMCEPKTPQI